MLIFVTNRKLCKDDFLNRIHQLAKGKPHAIMLREKDKSLEEYEELAMKINNICEVHQVPLIINQNISVAANLGRRNIHLSMENLPKYKYDLHPFLQIGASVHSVDEGKEAQDLGATYLIAGHIFSTDCKKGFPPRGLPFLKEVCDSVSIPVFAIGGITTDKIKDVTMTGAKGVCIMSEAMTCLNPEELVNHFRI
jgi:thiamine-phosphate diphosphorylase